MLPFDKISSKSVVDTKKNLGNCSFLVSKNSLRAFSQTDKSYCAFSSPGNTCSKTQNSSGFFILKASVRIAFTDLSISINLMDSFGNSFFTSSE